jgi:HK97 family phage portal protein
MIETLGSLALKAGHDLGEVRSDSLENPRTPLSRVFDVEPSWTGKQVSEISSLTLVPVFACVRILAGAIAKTPLNTYRRVDGGKHLAPDHYLYDLLKHRVNPYMSAFRFKRLMQAWALLWGNAYAEIVINGRGQITELWPWRPDKVRVDVVDKDLVYTYQMASGEMISRPSSHIFHLRGLEIDGYMGLSPIAQARQSVGLGLAAEEFGAKYFANNARPGMVITHPQKLSELARKNLVESWESIHKGLQGAHRMGVLEEGMKVQEISIPLEDAQFLQTRKFQAIDICRLFGVPPHKIAELDKATFSNIEHQGLEFVQDSLGDWFANWEAEIGMAMLSDRERQSILVGFDPSNLLRGDLQSTALALASLRQNGFINTDEGRERIGENPIGAEAGGQKYIVQLNMQDLANLGTEKDPNVAGIQADAADTVDTTGVSQEN